MFTGIVEEKGILKEIKRTNNSAIMKIEGNLVLEGTKVGDSIAVNGICLTVTKILGNNFLVDVMPESFRSSSLNQVALGDKVNLERALTLEKRMGGHIVTGHIDGVGIIRDFREEDNAIWITVKVKKDILRYIVHKGSVTLDGVSLTVAEVNDEFFKVSIIPQTAKETILLNKVVGDLINIECDLLGKYVERFLGVHYREEKKPDITKGFLLENGFL